MSMVPESVECTTCCLLYITLVNSLSSASSTSSSTVLWCCSQRPERMPRRMTACSRFRSSVIAKPDHELAAYTSFATTTDLKMMWTEAAVMPWVLSIRRTWTLCVINSPPGKLLPPTFFSRKQPASTFQWNGRPCDFNNG